MKKIFALTLLIFLIACKNNSSRPADAEDTTEKSEIEKKITKRDYSITVQNAYNDIFLDSNLVENFIVQRKLNDTLTRRLRSFYNARNYQFAWFSSEGVTEPARSFWNLHEYYNTYIDKNALNDKTLQKKMNYYLGADKIKVTPASQAFIDVELGLTTHFIQYLLYNYSQGQIKRKEMERFVPVKKENAIEVADSILNKKHKDDKYYADVNPSYKLLLQQLQKYVDISKHGGWQTIAMAGKKLKKGDSSATVLAVKKRLQATGEMPVADTSALYDDALEQAVKIYETSLGITPTGSVSAALVKEMNMPADYRIKKILVNMNRMRWMLSHLADNLILVNIPEFVLHVYENKKKVFDMNVVVGKGGHNTTLFTGNLNQVVFSPYWNVTRNIVEKEVLPAMQSDPEYLSRNNMEITGTEDGIPVIRQLPGPKNSLGKVKFLFPNSYDIYFHDTPAKDLFNRDKRAYSHGCIRLSDPFKMANYLLRNQSEWTPEKIDEAMNSGQEKYVRVKEPVPVLITYYTAWVDDSGILNFRDDIYGHDDVMMKKMFLN